MFERDQTQVMVEMMNATNPSSALYFIALNVVGSFVARCCPTAALVDRLVRFSRFRFPVFCSAFALSQRPTLRHCSNQSI